jgi:putative membrane protein insertion efficiency factor
MNQMAKTFVLFPLRAYKWAVSPLFPPACRYVPTCCDYAIEAVDRYGMFRGSGMAMMRVLRCHPFVKGGYDPVVKLDDHGMTQGAVRPASCVVAE